MHHLGPRYWSFHKRLDIWMWFRHLFDDVNIILQSFNKMLPIKKMLESTADRYHCIITTIPYKQFIQVSNKINTKPFVCPIRFVIERGKDKRCFQHLSNCNHITYLKQESEKKLHNRTSANREKLSNHNNTPNLIWFKPPLALTMIYPLVSAPKSAQNKIKPYSSQMKKFKQTKNSGR